jgi:hypothetical protein
VSCPGVGRVQIRAPWRPKGGLRELGSLARALEPSNQLQVEVGARMCGTVAGVRWVRWVRWADDGGDLQLYGSIGRAALV